MELSNRSREQLESELLGEHEAVATRCGDAAAGDYAAGSDKPRATELKHRLAIARELLLGEARSELSGRRLFDSPDKVREYLRLHFATLEREVFVVLMLDTQHRLIATEELFRGTLAQTAVYPREVVRAAMKRNSAAVVFAHNHPSGDAEPSRADEYLTQSLKAALALVDVRVLDHFVVAPGRLTSMSERGLL